MSETTSIGKFEITAELGRGGMGVVYKAWEDSLQRFVAIKMLADQLTQDQSVVQRFLREARAVADLNHPNVVQVFTVDTHEGRPYFAMEYVEGESLTDLIRTSNRVNAKRAAQIIKEAAAGLAAAHAKDVVHRDIKPDNIMLTRHGGVKVVDFGIAKMEDADNKLTATGMMVGTPNYISPEVCLGKEVDARSDIFSLGIVLYEMLAGTTPFNADSPIAMMTAVVQAEVPDITTLNPEVDANMRAILTHMLMKEPAYRYSDCKQIIEDLSAYLAGNPPPYATAAANDTTVVRERPELSTTTVEMPTPAAATAKPRGKRATQAGWIIGLLLIVGAAAGSWLYVDEPDAPVATDQNDVPVRDTAAADTGDEMNGLTDGEPEMADGERVMQLTGADTPADSVEPVEAEAIDLVAEAAGSDSLPAQSGDANALPAQETTPNVQTDIAANTLLPSDATSGQPQSPASVTEQTAPPAAVVIESKPVQPPGPPRLVVISQGDPAVAGVVESVLEGALAEADFPVMDENFFDGYNFTTSLAQLGNNVRSNGANILVYADIRETGQRRLNYYGRSERQTIASLEVRALLLDEKRNLGAPWTSSLEYVPLNAADNAREAAAPIAADLVERLHALAN